jgi:hypothetical protein
MFLSLEFTAKRWRDVLLLLRTVTLYISHAKKLKGTRRMFRACHIVNPMHQWHAQVAIEINPSTKYGQGKDYSCPYAVESYNTLGALIAASQPRDYHTLGG